MEKEMEAWNHLEEIKNMFLAEHRLGMLMKWMIQFVDCQKEKKYQESLMWEQRVQNTDQVNVWKDKWTCEKT